LLIRRASDIAPIAGLRQIAGSGRGAADDTCALTRIIGAASAAPVAALVRVTSAFGSTTNYACIKVLIGRADGADAIASLGAIAAAFGLAAGDPRNRYRTLTDRARAGVEAAPAGADPAFILRVGALAHRGANAILATVRRGAAASAQTIAGQVATDAVVGRTEAARALAVFAAGGTVCADPDAFAVAASGAAVIGAFTIFAAGAADPAIALRAADTRLAIVMGVTSGAVRTGIAGSAAVAVGLGAIMHPIIAAGDRAAAAQATASGAIAIYQAFYADSGRIALPAGIATGAARG
jgi:hypothetical protein